jgi:hypothetical protein
VSRSGALRCADRSFAALCPTLHGSRCDAVGARAILDRRIADAVRERSVRQAVLSRSTITDVETNDEAVR